MDLHRWMITDLEAVRTKLFSSVVDLVPTDRWHEHVDGGGSSLTHLLLHLTRHHDLAVNTVIRADAPLFHEHRKRLGLGHLPTGVGLAEREDSSATALVAPEPLIDYVRDVFAATAVWLEPLGTMILDSMPNSSHRLTKHAHLDADALPWLYSMWLDRPVWWLLQWPVLGHGNAHVGEAISVRNRMGLSPF